jgi:cell volume regulation protein A
MFPAQEFLTLPLLAAALLVLISVVAGVLSARAGFSFLLVFLLAGSLAGEDGPGGFVFNDFKLSFWVGNLALAVILLDGGLRTEFKTFRTGLKPAITLATWGVLVTAGLTGVAAHFLLGLDWYLAMLLGAIVGSTDAAAVFSLLQSSGVRLNERVAATLEIESGLNDPMAVFLTIAFITLALAQVSGEVVGAGDLFIAFVLQMGWGAALGLLSGWGLANLLRFLARWRDTGGGVRALLVVSAGLAVFAATSALHGSGFLAVYLMGVITANRARLLVSRSLSAMDGYAWLSQAGMFLLLGLLVTPSDVLATLWPALGVAVVLMMVARPVAVWLCLKPFKFESHEIKFISWVGLRGAVPIVLAVFPVMAGVPGAQTFFNVAFVVVLASLILQGATIPWASKRWHVALPDLDDTQEARQVFGDFVMSADASMGDFCLFYGLPTPDEPEQAVGDWLFAALGKPPVEGDMALCGAVEVHVRTMKDGRIEQVGIKLA